MTRLSYWTISDVTWLTVSVVINLQCICYSVCGSKPEITAAARSRARRVQLKCDGTRWRTGGEVKGKLAKRVVSQYSYTTSEHGASISTTADAHTSAASNRRNWRPRWFKWTRPFRRKTKSGLCACAITFQMQSTALYRSDTAIVDLNTLGALIPAWMVSVFVFWCVGRGLASRLLLTCKTLLNGSAVKPAQNFAKRKQNHSHWH